MAQEADISNETLVYWMDISVLCVITIFVVPLLPWLLTRFWHQLVSNPCFILRSRSSFRVSTISFSNARPQRPQRTLDLPHLYDEKQKWVSESDSKYSSSDCSHETSIWVPENRNISPPAHIPSYSTIFHPLPSLFSKHVIPGWSFGRVLILIALIAATLVVSFVAGGDPFGAPARQGWISTAFIPLAIAFSTKNNVIAVLLGVGYEKLNFLHRWVGIASFATANMHFLGYIWKWVVSTTQSPATELKELSNIYGLISVIGVNMVFLGSLPFVRQRFFKLFIYSHIVGYVLFLVFLYYHATDTLYWIILSAGIYALDHVLRLFKTRFAIAQVTALPSLGFVRMEIPSIKSGWAAGQHVRVRVLSNRLGHLGWSIAHPFTIATAPGMCGGAGMVLLAKKEGAWTRGLYDLAVAAKEPSLERAARVRVIVEGPYSGMGNMIVSSFTSALLVGGGSGVTLVLAQAEELVRDILLGKSAVRFIDLIWVTQDESSVAELVPSFTYILSQLPASYGVFIRVTIHYTRVSMAGSEQIALSLPLSSRLVVTPGRPAIAKTLERLALSAASQHTPRGVAVGVCGPAQLIHDVEQAAYGVSSNVRLACGGIEVHDESFNS